MKMNIVHIIAEKLIQFGFFHISLANKLTRRLGLEREYLSSQQGVC